MPEKKTSGQPMDTYAGDCGYCAGMAGNNPPASAQDAMPLTGEKEAHGLSRYGVHDWRGSIQDMTRQGGNVPQFTAAESMQDVGGPH